MSNQSNNKKLRNSDPILQECLFAELLYLREKIANRSEAFFCIIEGVERSKLENYKVTLKMCVIF